MNADRMIGKRFLSAMNARAIESTDDWTKWEIALLGNGTVEIEIWMETNEPYRLERIEQ